MSKLDFMNKRDYKQFKPEWGFQNLMVVAAFRYCLGRRTYIVSACVDWLLKYWNEIDENTKKLILEETKTAIERGYAGDSCDIQCWEKLVTHSVSTST